MSSFTHIDQEGRVRMVDVTRKEATLRTAVAQATVSLQPETLQKIIDRSIKKGNVLETARIAGIMAAKKTAELIPMCHPLNITHIRIDFVPDESNHSVQIEAGVRLIGPTGVEMEALTAVTVAALTIYDMCKSYDRDMIVTNIQLVKKTGGKSGTFLKSDRDDSDDSD
jgi:cyclic pyranopterin phosphate synthase